MRFHDFEESTAEEGILEILPKAFQLGREAAEFTAAFPRKVSGKRDRLATGPRSHKAVTC
jgi:hypothetical protein